MPSCLAIGCDSGKRYKTRSNHKLLEIYHGITFHKFPADVERRKAWIEAVGREDWEPTESVRICSLHFEERFIDRTSVNTIRLKKDAVPTIFKNRALYAKRNKRYFKVKTTPVKAVKLEKDAVPTIFDTWLSHAKSKKKCSEVTEAVKVEEEMGSCPKDDSVPVELGDPSSDSESLAKVDSVSKKLSYSSSNLTKAQLKQKIEYLEQQNELNRRENRDLQRFKCRAVKKIKKLNEIIKFLKENRMMEEDSLKVLTFNRPMFPIGNIISHS